MSRPKVFNFAGFVSFLSTGLPPKDVAVTMNPPVAEVGSAAEIFVSWSEGTDLQFTIDFGDGNTYDWHWEVKGQLPCETNY